MHTEARDERKVEYLTLAQAAKLAPGRPSANCLWRWCRKGVLSRSRRRVRLQHVRVGRHIYTTAEWVHTFGLRLADADSQYFDTSQPVDPPSPPAPRKRTESQRQADIDQAEQELREMGVLPQ